MRHHGTSRAARVLATVVAVVLTSLSVGPALPGSAQSTWIAVDTPLAEEVVSNGQTVLVAGWAADSGGPGTGIDRVYVYIDGPAGTSGREIGAAAYGQARPDVAAAFDRPEWSNSGYELEWSVSDLPGPHVLYVYAHSTATDQWTFTTRAIRVAAGAPTRVPGPPPPAFPPYESIPPYAPIFPFEVFPVVVAVAARDGTVSLTWIPRADAIMYRVYRSPTGDSYSFVLVQTVSQRPTGVPATNATVAGLTPGSTHHFQVRAVDADGLETLVPAALAAIGGFVATLSAAASSMGRVALTWPPIPSAAAYRVYQSASGDPSTFSLVRTVSQSLGAFATAALISGLTPGVTYYFQVRAAGPRGEETLIASRALGGLDVVLPPAGLSIAAATATTVTLAWAPSPAVQYYRVYQSTTGTPGSYSSAVVSLSTSTGAMVVGLAPSTMYHFYATAMGPDGQESTASNTVSTMTTMPPTPTSQPRQGSKDQGSSTSVSPTPTATQAPMGPS